MQDKLKLQLLTVSVLAGAKMFTVTTNTEILPKLIVLKFILKQ